MGRSLHPRRSIKQANTTHVRKERGDYCENKIASRTHLSLAEFDNKMR
jgi:hypothetical protein